MRTVRILDEASQEAIEAAGWYELEQPGLGGEFFAALDAAIDLIEEGLVPLVSLPESVDNPEAKRLILDRFPYDIVVMEYSLETLVIAVAHHARKPGYWKNRGSPGHPITE